MRKAILLAILALCAFETAHANPITIHVRPGAQSVTLASQAIVDVFISGLGAASAPSVGVFDINLDFDPSIISFVDVSYGTGLDVLGLGSLQITSAGFGTVNLFELSFDTVADLDALQGDSFLLARLTFDSIDIGTSAVNISLNALGDAEGTALTATLTDGSLTVHPTSVGEPSTLILLLVGLSVLVLRRTAKTGPPLIMG